MLLIGGSAIYESYDEGPNVVITVPYLDQEGYDTILREGLIDFDACSCPSASTRNSIVSKRAAVLVDPLDDTEDLNMDVDEGNRYIYQSPEPTPDYSSPVSVPMELDTSPIDESPPTANVQLALDGPHAALAAGKLEPDGPLDLRGEYITLVMLSHLIASRLRRERSCHRKYKIFTLVWRRQSCRGIASYLGRYERRGVRHHHTLQDPKAGRGVWRCDLSATVSIVEPYTRIMLTLYESTPVRPMVRDQVNGYYQEQTRCRKHEGQDYSRAP